MKRAHKYRFYPTPAQAGLLNRTFGSVRYVYNRALAERSRAWTQEHKRVTFAETCRMLTRWKNNPDTAWLYQVSNVALQQGLQHLQNAYVSFWAKRARYPTFKSIEDLPVRNMVRNHTPARAISDAAWAELRRQLEYKADWYRRTLIAVDRFYPSSRTCSACGVITATMPLTIREWVCAACGVRHDRDVNAAKVIRAEGLSVQACGDGVRPSRA